MSSTLPIVIFDGNCQGQHLAAILTASNIAECYAIGQDLGFLPSHLGIACRYLDEGSAFDLVAAAKEQGRLVIQGTQSTPMSDGTEMSYTPLVDKIIRYPHLQFYAASPNEAKQRFGPRARPLRMLDMDIGIMEKCQSRAESNVDFAGFIKEHAPHRSLFHTALHPNGEITGKLLRSFATQIPGVNLTVVECAERYLEQSEGINSSTYHPVATELLHELGFDWGEEYEQYRQMMTQRSCGDYRTLIKNQELYVEKFRNDTWCWLSLTQAHTALGSIAKAEICLARLLDLSPGHLHSWLCGLNLFISSNNHAGISALAHRANGFFKGQRIFSQVMAYFHLNLGQPREAEPYARDYHSRTPDRADALVPLLKTLIFLDRKHEAKQIFDYEASIATPSRMMEIRANFVNSPELLEFLPA